MEGLLGIGKGGGPGPAPGLRRGGPGVSKGDMVHAQHMWEFLDDLHAKSPDEYKKFIEKKMREAKKVASEHKRETPKPSFVISSSMKDSPDPIFVNFMGSSRCPPLKTKDGKPATAKTPLDEVLVPISVGKIQDGREGQNRFKYANVIFHPNVISRAERELQFKLYIVEIAVQNVEEDCKVVISRGYKLEPNIRYKGNPVKAKKSTLSAPSSQKTPSSTEEPQDIVMPEQFAKALGVESENSKSKAKTKQGKGPLIIDITSEEGSLPKAGTDGSYAIDASKEPEAVVARIFLLRAEKASDVAADITDASVTITGIGYNIKVQFPFKVNSSRATARFRKKKKILIIKAPALR